MNPVRIVLLLRLAVFCGVSLEPLALAAQKPVAPVTVKVYVTSIGAVDGFTDPNKDNQDAAKDLTKAIQRITAERFKPYDSRDLGVPRKPDGHGRLIVTDAIEDAAITLVVLSRERAQVTAGFLGPARDCIVRVKFRFKDLETELVGSAQGGTLATAWAAATAKVAKQVDDWVFANRARFDE